MPSIFADLEGVESAPSRLKKMLVQDDSFSIPHDELLRGWRVGIDEVPSGIGDHPENLAKFFWDLEMSRVVPAWFIEILNCIGSGQCDEGAAGKVPFEITMNRPMTFDHASGSSMAVEGEDLFVVSDSGKLASVFVPANDSERVGEFENCAGISAGAVVENAKHPIDVPRDDPAFVPVNRRNR